MNKLIIITGPTAVGKTDISIKLAKRIGGEIISADSMQVYRGMNIGTAKIRKDEMQGVPHHLIDILDPSEEYDVARFKDMAKEAISDIYSRGHVPIIAGGTGFYIQAVLYDIDFSDEDLPSGEKILGELRAISGEPGGADKLHSILEDIDPESARIIHKNNIKRVIRAIYFSKVHNKKISDHNAEQRASGSPYDFEFFVLNMDRASLYERIDRRVDLMLKEGLPSEALGLIRSGELSRTAAKGIGYREIIEYISDNYPDVPEALTDKDMEIISARIKLDTRHFAKRQLTWFRRERDTDIIDKDSFGSDDEIVSYMLRASGLG